MVRVLIASILIFSVIFSSGINSTGAIIKFDPWATSSGFGWTPYISHSFPYLVFSTPAAITPFSKTGFAISYAKWLADSKVGAFAFQTRISRRTSLLLGGKAFWVPEWDNDNWMESGGQEPVTASEFYGKIGIARKLNRFNSRNYLGFGLVGNIFYTNLGDISATAVASDLSFLWAYRKKLYIGFNLKNLTIHKAKYLEQGYHLPSEANAVANISFRLTHNTKLDIGWTSGILFDTPDKPFFSLGTRINYGRLWFSGGYRYRDSYSHFSVGMGINLSFPKNTIELGYSFSPWDNEISYTPLSANKISAMYSGREIICPVLLSPENNSVFELKNTETKRVTIKWLKSFSYTDEKQVSAYHIKVSTDKQFIHLVTDTIISVPTDEETLKYELPFELCHYQITEEGDTIFDYNSRTFFWSVWALDPYTSTEIKACNAPFSFVDSVTMPELKDRKYKKHCPPIIKSIEVSNSSITLDTITMYIEDLPLIPIVFFDDGETEIVNSPCEHSSTVKKRVPTDPYCGKSAFLGTTNCDSVTCYSYYDDLFNEIHNKMLNNPDVMLQIKAYTSKRSGISWPDFVVATNRANKVKNLLEKHGIPSDRIQIIDPHSYDFQKRRVDTWSKNPGEVWAIQDENRRVEIDAIIPEFTSSFPISYSLDISKDLDVKVELHDSSLQQVPFEKIAEILRRNPDVHLTLKVSYGNKFLTFLQNKIRQSSQETATSFAFKIGSICKQYIADHYQIPDNRIFIIVLFNPTDNIKATLSLSADAVVYSVRKLIKYQVNREEFENNPAIIKVRFKYPCKTPGNIVSVWGMKILNSVTNEPVFESQFTSPPDTMEILKWNWTDNNGNLVDYHVPYKAQIFVKLNNDSVYYRMSNINLTIKARKSIHVEKTLINVFKFDRINPLSYVMETRMPDAIKTFVNNLKYKEKNKYNLSIENKFIFYGATDYIGNDEYNHQLSLKRARYDKSLFISMLENDPWASAQMESLYGPDWQLEINPYIEIKPLSDTKPIMSNETPEGRTINRRTFLEVYFKERELNPSELFLQRTAYAESLYKHNKFEEAIIMADSALNLSPNPEEKMPLLKLKYACATKLEDLNTMEKTASEILDLSPSSVEWNVRFLKILINKNELDKARNFGSKIVEKFPDESDVHLWYAEALLASGKSYWNEAKKEYEIVLEKDPRNTKVLKRLEVLRDFLE